MELLTTLCVCVLLIFAQTKAIPVAVLYDHNVPEAVRLPNDNDVSSPPIRLKVPLIFYGAEFDSIFVNSNGLLSFQTAIPNFFNIEFPLDYPLIAPFYSNVDTRSAGTVSYYETTNPKLLARASAMVGESFLDFDKYQATSLFIATWFGVGYYNLGHDKINTYQVAISTDGDHCFVEFLYAKDGLQWIQGTGDDSGLPDARAQVGLISSDGKIFSLPGSGTEQVRNLETWSNIHMPGQFIYRIDSENIQQPDSLSDSAELDDLESPTCAESPTSCHVQARCIDFDDGLCCACKKQFYGNGLFCVNRETPLRVNGKVAGKVNGELLENLDLQSYIVMADGRAYTAISKVPESIGFDSQSLQILGGVIGYLFAKPIRNSLNGYQITGGVFNHTATIRFLNTSQTVTIVQKYTGLDVFDQLRLEVNIQGDIPTLPDDSKVEIDEYSEEYTQTAAGVVQATTVRGFSYLDNGLEVKQLMSIEQTFLFDYCKFDSTAAESTTWRLRVGKNFISYEAKEQIIRFGLSSKVTPLGDIDPCEEGRLQCFANSACVVHKETFQCVCNHGYQLLNTVNGSICADINECQSGLQSCDVNAQCVNQVGTYSCECNPGFIGNGQMCENEYSCQKVHCNENAECVENNQVAECRCLQGYTGNGTVCTPLQTHNCLLANNCNPFAMCSPEPGTDQHQCICLPGYEGNGYECEKIETNTTETRKEVQRCVMGICWCPEGLKINPNSSYCVTERELIEDAANLTDSCKTLNKCNQNAQCLSNTTDHSSFVCQCNEGFSGDGFHCSAAPPPSATSAACASNGDCTPTEECRREECVCIEGYVRDPQLQCVNPSTCGGGRCVEHAECLFDEEYQLSYCSCRSGYVGDGILECKPKPVGCNVDNRCGLHAHCYHAQAVGAYQCRCDAGFYGDGFVCYTESNCHVNPGLCDREASCVASANERYICQCKFGFGGNGSVCVRNQKHDGNFLLLNQGMATLKIPFEPSRTNVGRPVQIKLSQTAVGLDVDCYEGRVYWSDITNGAIRGSSYNGSAKADLLTKDIGSPEGLAVDWLSRNIYWTDSMRDTIEVASLDGKRRRVLFNDNLVNPRGIAVHPQRGKIFWTDWDRKNPKIEWANADGTQRSVFLRGESVSLPNSLTIDFDTEHLCYTDAGTKKVECVSIDNRARRTIAENCTYPFGIAVNNRHIYWSDWITKQIERVDKSNLARLPPLKLPLGGTGNKLYGLVAVPENCPALTNICQYSKNQCPLHHICTPNGNAGKSCVCTFNAQDSSETPSCSL